MISQWTSIKGKEWLQLPMGRGRGFVMMVGKWNWLFWFICGIQTFLIDHMIYHK